MKRFEEIALRESADPEYLEERLLRKEQVSCSRRKVRAEEIEQFNTLKPRRVYSTPTQERLQTKESNHSLVRLTKCVTD